MVSILHDNEYSGQRRPSVSLPEIPVGEQVSVRADIWCEPTSAPRPKNYVFSKYYMYQTLAIDGYNYREAMNMQYLIKIRFIDGAKKLMNNRNRILFVLSLVHSAV